MNTPEEAPDPLARTVRLTVTGTTLLQRLADPDNRSVWEAYVGRYRPVLLRTLRHGGLADADAEDVAQVVLLEFVEGLRAGRYERDRGRLRSWLFGILRNQLRNFRRRGAGAGAALVHSQSAAEEALEQAPGTSELERIWDEEWRQSVLEHVMGQVRQEVSETRWRAFELFVLNGLPAADAAARLNETQAFVYAAKRRILERVRSLQPVMEELF